MKRTSILVILLLSLPCRGATYYVSTTGSNTSPYDTWVKAALLPETVVTAGNTDVGGEGPHTVNIAAGTYDSSIYLNDADWVGATVIGAGSGLTIISGASARLGCGSTADNVTWQDLRVIATGTNIGFFNSNSALGTVLRNVDIFCDTGHTASALSLGGTIELYNCRCFDYAANELQLCITSTGTATCLLQNCIFGPYSSAGPAGYSSLASGTWTVNNCVAFGSYRTTFTITGATFTANNCIFQGGTNRASNTILRSSGTANLYNNLIIAGPWVDDPTSGTLAVDSGNVYGNLDPKLGTRRGGFLLVRVDNAENLAYAQALETKLAAYGWQGTFAIDTAEWNEADNATLRTMVAAGTMEAAAHGYSHTILTTVNALSITYTGSDTNPTVAFTAGGALQFRTTEGNDDADLDTTAAAYDTFTEIAAADPANWGIALGTGVSGYVLPTSLAVVGATAVPCSLEFDLSGYNAGFFKDEITDPKAYLASVVNGAGNVSDPQTGTTYVCNSWIAPSWDVSTAARKALRDAGYKAAAARLAGYSFAETSTHCADVNMVAIGSLYTATYLKGDGTETEVRERARAIAIAAAYDGMAFSIIAHDEVDFTLDQWDWVFDEWNDFGEGITVTSHQLFWKTVDESDDWTDLGDARYTREYAITDYRLQVGSPCINVGLIPTGYEVAYLLSPSLTTLSPWTPEVATTDYAGAREIGAFAYEQSAVVSKSAKDDKTGGK